MKLFDPRCRNTEICPRGKAVWNANGGFVSVLLTHLLIFVRLSSLTPIVKRVNVQNLISSLYALSCEQSFRTRLLISTEYTNVTDRQTTLRWHRQGLCIPSRRKNAKTLHHAATERHFAAWCYASTAISYHIISYHIKFTHNTWKYADNIHKQ